MMHVTNVGGKSRTSFDVVVIGGGITGVNAALWLARRGLAVCLLERRAIASSQSGHSAGMVGSHRATPIKLDLAVRAMPAWRNFCDVYETSESPYHETGRLYLYGEELVDVGHRVIAAQQQRGVDAQVLDPDVAQSLEPGLDIGGAPLIAWEPQAGVVDPAIATRAVADAAMRAGAHIRQWCEVRSIRVSSDSVVGVDTGDGHIASPIVLVATAAWAPSLLAPLHIRVPIEARPSPAIYLRRTGDGRQTHTTVVDMRTSSYVRDVGLGISMVGKEPESTAALADPDLNVETISWEVAKRLTAQLGRLLPTYRDSVLLGGNNGIYDITPDGHPILDKLSTHEGLYIMAGFSGDGFKYGPALGELFAEWLVDGKPSLDLAALRLDRFASGKLIPPEFPGVAVEGTSVRSA